MGVPTITDVARLAGVTRGTVSRAFNGYEDISADTKARIMRVAQEIGYVPNKSARNIALKKTNNIALIFSDYEVDNSLGNAMPLLTNGAVRHAHDRDMEMISYFITAKMQQQKSYDQFCREHSISGAILFGIRLSDPWNDLLDIHFPCITIDIEIDSPYVGSVLTDDCRASEEMCDLLVELGHKKIAVLYGRRHAMVTQKRWQGIQKSITKHNLEIKDSWIIDTDFMYDIAYDKCKQFIREHGLEVTAFLCMSDVEAFAAIQAITEEGYSVPEDYTVTGYDGFNISRYSKPTITTIDQNFFQKGYAAAQLLSDMLNNPSTRKNITVPYSLIKGNSSSTPSVR